MKGLELLLNFYKNKAYLCRSKAIPLTDIDLPEWAFEFEGQASWLLKVISYNPDKQSLFVDVFRYNQGNKNFDSEQCAMSAELTKIKKIRFRSLDTAKLLWSLPVESKVQTFKVTEAETPKMEAVQAKQPELKKDSTEDHFKVGFQKLCFVFGGVEFEYQHKRLAEPMRIFVANELLRPEFEVVKNYFARILLRRSIDVDLNITWQNSEPISISANSKQISQISREHIETMRFNYLQDEIRKQANNYVDKSLFTMDDFFEEPGQQKMNANAFYSDEQDFFQDMLKMKNTKHYQNLMFLAENHDYMRMKIRFILKPFSFLFLLEGDTHWHIVWETLNTREATYIWPCEKNKKQLNSKLQRVGDIINTIRVQGKTAYITSTEDQYKRIIHDYSDLINGFVKWKGNLEAILF